MANINNKLNNKLIKGIVLDASGHSEVTKTVDEAVAHIVDQVKTSGKWVFVNGSPFIFQNVDDPNEQANLFNRLNTTEDAEYQLTGSLRGGASAAKKTKPKLVRARVLSTPVSSFFNSRNRPQLAVVMKQNHGKEIVDVVVSNYKGSRHKLAGHTQEILAQVQNLLAGNSPAKNSKKKA